MAVIVAIATEMVVEMDERCNNSFSSIDASYFNFLSTTKKKQTRKKKFWFNNYFLCDNYYFYFSSIVA